MKTALAAIAVLTLVAPASAQTAQHADQGEATAELPPRPDVKIGNFGADEGKGSLARKADYAEAMNSVAERQKVFAGEPEHFTLQGSFAQGGLVFGQTEIGAKVTLDGEPVMVDNDGRFLIGFGRDAPQSALLVVSLPDGLAERRAVAAGMISSDVISRMPTIFIAMAMVSAMASMNRIRARCGRSPSASASSSLTVADSSGRQIMNSRPSTPAPTTQISTRSRVPTARMSPNR